MVMEDDWDPKGPKSTKDPQMPEINIPPMVANILRGGEPELPFQPVFRKREVGE